MNNQPPTIFVEDPEETIDQTIQRLHSETGVRMAGYGRPIEIALKDIGYNIEKNWKTIITSDFTSQWIPQFEDNAIILNEIPDIGPRIPEGNPTNYTVTTEDSPAVKKRNQIRYQITRSEPAGFGRKMFSKPKELKPRIRFVISRKSKEDENMYENFKIGVKTSEHVVSWHVYARNNSECDYLYKCMEYIVETNRKMFYDYGLQEVLTLGSPAPTTLDSSSDMLVRKLDTYMRIEEFYHIGPIASITELEYDWNDKNFTVL